MTRARVVWTGQSGIETTFDLSQHGDELDMEAVAVAIARELRAQGFADARAERHDERWVPIGGVVR